MSMKKVLFSLTIVFSLLLTNACSRNKTKNKAKQDSKMLKEEDLFASDNLKGGDKDSFNEKEEAVSILDKMEEVESSVESSSLSGDYKTYKVQKSDTLMLISFKLYGDYR